MPHGVQDGRLLPAVYQSFLEVRIRISTQTAGDCKLCNSSLRSEVQFRAARSIYVDDEGRVNLRDSTRKISVKIIE